MNEALANKIKAMMAKTLDLDEGQLNEIGADMPLMDNGLGLDSIDALELIVQVEKEFGVKIESSEAARKAFSSFGAFVAFVEDAHIRSPSGD